MFDGMIKFGKRGVLLACACSVFAVAGCASNENSAYMSDGEVVIYDPLEDTNRAIFQFNKAVDDAVIHPVIKGYRFVVPQEARNGLGNFLRNLKSPVIFANEVLQGDIEGAGNVLLRAVINTFAGFGGFFDFAGKHGYPHQAEDFGQTLAVWGMDNGPYLVVPILGPATARDAAGYIVDSYMDPLRWYLFDIDKEDVYYTKSAVEYLNLRDELMDVLGDIQKSSIDYYASTRSVYYQRREALVKDENPDDVVEISIPDYDE